MNQTTGYFTFPTSSGKLTTISDDYVSTADQTYYTCMNQTSNGNCFTVYTIDGYTSSTSNGVTNLSNYQYGSIYIKSSGYSSI